MNRRYILKILVLSPFFVYQPPKQIRLIIPNDLTMDQLADALVNVYRDDDSDQAIPEFVLDDGRVLSNTTHLIQTVWEYDLAKQKHVLSNSFNLIWEYNLRKDFIKLRIYREILPRRSSVSTFRYNWFLFECCVAFGPWIPRWLREPETVTQRIDLLPIDNAWIHPV